MVALAALLGAAIGAGAAGAVLADGDDATPELTPSRLAVQELPAGPVGITAETIRLGSGFTSRHRHGGPTVNLVRSGRIEIDDAEGARSYGPGDAFLEPGGRVHTIRVLDAARIDVIRLLPPGADATTEVPGPARP